MSYNRKPVPAVVRTPSETVTLADGLGRTFDLPPSVVSGASGVSGAGWEQSVRASVSRSDFNRLLGDALDNLGASTRAAAAAFRTLNEEFGPPEEIVELAERRSAELGITVSCERVRSGRSWEVVVRTRRGNAQCEPFLSDKQSLELPEDLALVTAWKNAFTQLGLL